MFNLNAQPQSSTHSDVTLTLEYPRIRQRFAPWAYTETMLRLLPNDLPTDVVLVDVRDELEAMAFPLEQISAGRAVINVPFADLEDGVALNFPNDHPLVVVCGNGSRGELAGAYLMAAGAGDVSVLDGGLRAWRRSLEGEVVLEFRVKVDGMRTALLLQNQLEALPNVRQAGVSAAGLAVVRGTVSLEQIRKEVPELEVL
jgi:rhodanese-related sulfurtransferase